MEPLECTHCSGGVAYPIFSDESGANYQCFYCRHGFTVPASAESQSGSVGRQKSVYPPTVEGEPGIGAQGHDTVKVHEGGRAPSEESLRSQREREGAEA